MHLKPGEIRAYQDNELDSPAQQRAADHLASCPRCQEAARQISARSVAAHQLLTRLQPDHQTQPAAIHQSRQRLAARLAYTQKEQNSMSKNILSRLSRPAWAAITLALVLAVALAFPGVRAAAVSFLGLFRVEEIRVVEVDMDRLPGGLDSSANLEKIFSRDIQIQGGGEPKEVASAAEAVQLAGFNVRLPALDLPAAFYVQPGGSMIFNVDLDLVQAVLKDIGRQDIQLPKALDQATVEVTVNAGLVALYGGCRYLEPPAAPAGQDPAEAESWAPEECLTLIQMPSPTVTAPPELNLAQIGEAYLQLLGLSQEEAASFARSIDWTTTFIVPIPRGHRDYREISVDGVQGVLIDNYGHVNLIWVKDGIIYALSGPRKADQMLAIANSLP